MKLNHILPVLLLSLATAVQAGLTNYYNQTYTVNTVIPDGNPSGVAMSVDIGIGPGPGAIPVNYNKIVDVNVTLNLVLIPFTQARWGNGAIGAATSLLLTELFQVTLSIAIIGRKLLVRSTVVRIGKASVAAVGMAAVLAMLDGVLFPVQIVVGAGVFALLCVLLRLPTAEEWHMGRQGLARLSGKVRAKRSGRGAR